MGNAFTCKGLHRGNWIVGIQENPEPLPGHSGKPVKVSAKQVVIRWLQKVNFGSEWTCIGWVPSEGVRACGVED